MKVVTRNHLLRKLENYKWGINAGTIRTTALAFCFSVAEYGAPVWSRSKHTHLLDPEHRIPEANKCRRLYLLAGIAPSDIRRDVCARIERAKQVNNKEHSLFGHTPATNRLNLDGVSYLQFNPLFSAPKSINAINAKMQ